jgi:oligoribonuclease
MDEWNQEHHSKSGLLQNVKESVVSLEMAEDMILDFLKQNNVEYKQSPLAGNSVHADRIFIER